MWITSLVTAEGEWQHPEVTSRTFAMGVAEAPVSTSLDRSIFAVGEVIFQPDDLAGQYHDVVEVRGEGYGPTRL